MQESSGQNRKKNMLRSRISRVMERVGRQGIQASVLVSFTVVAVLVVLLLSLVLYNRFTQRTRVLMTESTQQLMSQTEANLEDYLTSMRRGESLNV